MTNLVAIAAFALWGYLLYSSNDEEGIEGVPNRSMAKFAVTVAVALLYITCMFGVNLYFRSSTASYAIPNVYHRMITLVFALTLVTLMGRGKLRLSAWLQLAAMAVCFVYFLGSQGEVNELRGMVLAGKAAWGHFYMQWVDTLLLGTLFYLVIQNIRKQPEEFAASEKALSIIITLLLLTFLSMELLHIYVIAGYHSYSVARLEEQYSKAGLTVIWALSSFVLMLLGMKHRKKTLRIISLVLFSVVLLKLFLMDISEISEGGKILAFILLGVLLLTVSLLYQKLKKIITDEEKV